MIKKKIIFLFFVLMVGAAILGALTYRAPLLSPHTGGLGRIYDFISYSYFFSKMEWLKTAGNERGARQAAAQAAWHRPQQAEALIGIKPENFWALGKLYHSRGLDTQALFLLAAAEKINSNEKLHLDITSLLAGLKSWHLAARAAKNILELNPENPEAAYWLGQALFEQKRTDEAIPYLEMARTLSPKLADATYLLGRCRELTGKKEAALDLYQDTVKLCPRHREGWEGIIQLETDPARKQKAALALKKLIPPLPAEQNVDNSFVFLGTSLPEKNLKTSERLEIELYLSAWRPKVTRMAPNIFLFSQAGGGRIYLKSDQIQLNEPGAVIKKKLSWKLPRILFPGTIHWGMELSPDQDIFFPSFRIAPRWLESIKDQRKDQPGRSLQLETFLGPKNQLSQILKNPSQANGVAVVSNLHRSRFIPQEEPVAQLTVTTKEKGVLNFTLRAGIETAEVWWENADPKWLKHDQAQVYNSWKVTGKSGSFNACDYLAIFPFEQPLTITSISVKNLTTQSGLNFNNIMLLNSSEPIVLSEYGGKELP